MESRSITCTDGKNCFEVGTITFEGKEFSNLGSCVYHDEQGKLRGVLYTGNDDTYLQTWDGKIKVPCKVGSTWKGNFIDYNGRRQVNRSYFFTLHGKRCRGVNYNREWSEIVRFKEV